ncbi:uncharacterized protein LOC102801769 [Saccoglossus kowalevskii]
MRAMGQVPGRKTLYKDAVPTIHTGVLAESISNKTDTSPAYPAVSTPKRPRIAFLKRENARVTLQYSEDTHDEDTSHQVQDTDSLTDSSIQTLTKAKTVRTYGTQISYKQPNKRSVRVQVRPFGSNKVCQTEMLHPPERRSVQVQCDLLKPNQTIQVQEPPPDNELDTTWSSLESNATTDSDETYEQSECESQASCSSADDW